VPCAGILAAADVELDGVVATVAAVVVEVGVVAFAIAEPPTARAATPAAPINVFFTFLRGFMISVLSLVRAFPGSPDNPHATNSRRPDNSLRIR
jgi:hypothetical protein